MRYKTALHECIRGIINRAAIALLQTTFHRLIASTAVHLFTWPSYETQAKSPLKHSLEHEPQLVRGGWVWVN